MNDISSYIYLSMYLAQGSIIILEIATLAKTYSHVEGCINELQGLSL